MNILTRLITGAVLLCLTIALLFYSSSDVFSLITLVITVFMAYEWTYLIGITRRVHALVWTIVFALALTVLHFKQPLARNLFMYLLPILGVFWCCVAGSAVRYSRWYASVLSRKLLALTLGYILLAGFWLSLTVFHHSHFHLLWALLVSIAAYDSCAYFSGKLYGKKALCADISPHKTWEGVWGGALGALLVSCVCVFIVPEYLLALIYLPVAAVAVFFSIYGDIFESIVKRLRGNKDSGILLPGHGGFLDRCDSYIAALPTSLFVVQYLTLVK